MRVLFSCSASDGHFLPLVPLAHAFAERGDTVAFATAAGFADKVGSSGFAVLAAGIDNDQLRRRYTPYHERLQTMPFDERRARALVWRFAELDAPAKIDALLIEARAWAPDLIVHETADLAAPAVAAALDVRSAHHTFGLGLPPACLDAVTPAVEPLWARVGLEPAPFAGLFRGTYIDISPAGLHPAEPPAGTQIIPLRPALRGTGSAEWRDRLPTEHRVVYVTLGTQFNDTGRFALLFEALATVDHTAIVTVGANQDPSTLHAPANVIVEQFIPQGEVLPLADAVLCHGGSGSTLAALAHGVPLVMLPSAADQFENAAACSRSGAAIELRPPAVSVESIRSSLEAVLAEPRFVEAARQLATEVDAMLTPDEAAAILS